MSYTIKPKTVASVSVTADFTVVPDLYNLIINNASSTINITIPDLDTFTDKTELTFINGSAFPMNIVTNNQILTTMAPSTTQIYIIYQQSMYNIFNVAADTPSSISDALKIDGSTAMTGALNMAANKIISAANPSDAQDAATKGYCDSLLMGSGSLYIKTNGTAAAATAALNMGGNKIVNVANPFDAQDAATKAHVQGNVSTNTANLNSMHLRVDGANPMSADLNMGGASKIVNVANPTAAQDAATKAYVDANVGTGFLKLDGTNAMSAALNMGGASKIVGVADPSAAQDAATKAYVDSLTLNAIQSPMPKNGSRAMTGALNMGTSNKIINVANPISATDAATRGYSSTTNNLGIISIFDLKWDYPSLPPASNGATFNTLNGYSFRQNFASVSALPFIWSTLQYAKCDATYVGNTISIDIGAPRPMIIWCLGIKLGPAFDNATSITLLGGSSFGNCTNVVITGSAASFYTYTEFASTTNTTPYRYYTVVLTTNRVVGKSEIEAFEMFSKTF
jgi:hypothetical protein